MEQELNNVRNLDELLDLIDMIEEKIDSGKLHRNMDGYYKMSKCFDGVDKRIYARGIDARELAYDMLMKKYKQDDVEIHEEETPFYKVANEWYNVRIKTVGLSPKSVTNQKCILNRHILPKFHDRDMRQMKNSEVQIFLNEKAVDYSFSTVKKIKDVMVAIFAYAEDNDYIMRNHVRRLVMPKCKSFVDDSTDPVTVEELTLAMKAAANNPMMLLAIVMLYVYGMRTVELVNLEWRFVDFDNDYFKIDKSKYTDAITTRNAELTKRYLPLSPTVKKLMYIFLAEVNSRRYNPKGDFVFIKKNIKKLASTVPMDTTSMDKYFATLTREMEIVNGAEVFNNKIVKYTGVRHFTPYAFRKGVVTRLNAYNYNDSITQMFVGHSPKEVKDRYYSKMNFEEHLRQNYQRYMDETDKVVVECLKNAGIDLWEDQDNN